MTEQAEFQERVVRVPTPDHFFKYLVDDDGMMLGMNEHHELVMLDEADDRVIWDQKQRDMRHVSTGQVLDAAFNSERCSLNIQGKPTQFSIKHGPALLPSAYLAHLKREGWVCLTAVLTEDIIERLQKLAGSDAYEHLTMNNDLPKICQDAAVGCAIAEPISLWLIRSYMGTRDLHLGHPPGFAVLRPYDGKSPVQGWHSDIPYIPSIGGNLIADRDGPIKAVQRNVCVSDFKKANGATAYKLGSHLADNPPPEWNPARHGGPENARPYSGSEADVVEAPAGSIVLYDARTWHRAGINHSNRKRAAMLQSFQAADVIPKRDTRPVCKKLHDSPVYAQLNLREQREITKLLMNQPESTISPS